jgi:hypothetical protein
MQRTKPEQKVPLTILMSWCILHCIYIVPFGTYAEDQMDPCQLYCEILQPSTIIYQYWQAHHHAHHIEIEDHTHFENLWFLPFNLLQWMVAILVFVNLHSKYCFLLFHDQTNLIFNILSFLILGFCFHLLFIFFSSLKFFHVVLIYMVATKKIPIMPTIF